MSLLAIIALSSCDLVDGKLKIINQSNYHVFCHVYYTDSIMLRDSLNIEPFNGYPLRPDTLYKINVAPYGSWEDRIEYKSPDNKLRINFYHKETVNRYSWKYIFENKKYEQNYTLSIEQLDSLNWIVSYPLENED